MQKTDWEASRHLFIWPHQQTTVAENVLNKSRGEHFREDLSGSGCNSLYMPRHVVSPQVYESDMTWSLIYM